MTIITASVWKKQGKILVVLGDDMSADKADTDNQTPVLAEYLRKWTGLTAAGGTGAASDLTKIGLILESGALQVMDGKRTLNKNEAKMTFNKLPQLLAELRKEAIAKSGEAGASDALPQLSEFIPPPGNLMDITRNLRDLLTEMCALRILLFAFLNTG